MIFYGKYFNTDIKDKSIANNCLIKFWLIQRGWLIYWNSYKSHWSLNSLPKDMALMPRLRIDMYQLPMKVYFLHQIGRNLSILLTIPTFSVVTSRWQQSLCDDDSIQKFKTSNTSNAWRNLYKKAIMLIVLLSVEVVGTEDCHLVSPRYLWSQSTYKCSLETGSIHDYTTYHKITGLWKPKKTPLQWCHNGCDGISNHQPYDC